jgi:hypothetical protein
VYVMRPPGQVRRRGHRPNKTNFVDLCPSPSPVRSTGCQVSCCTIKLLPPSEPYLTPDSSVFEFIWSWQSPTRQQKAASTDCNYQTQYRLGRLKVQLGGAKCLSSRRDFLSFSPMRETLFYLTPSLLRQSGLPPGPTVSLSYATISIFSTVSGPAVPAPDAFS